MGAVIVAMFGEALICLLVGWVITIGVNILVVGAKLLKFIIGLLVLSPLFVLAWLLFPFFLDATVWLLFAFYHVVSWLWIAFLWCVKVCLWIVCVGIAVGVVAAVLKRMRG